MVIAKIVGRVPVDKEDWVEGKAYKRRNQVHRFNCIFESRIDNNTISVTVGSLNFVYQITLVIRLVLFQRNVIFFRGFIQQI